MLAMTGFLMRTVSRQIKSLAVADPPGLSIRSTMADTLASSAALRRAATIVVEPIAEPPKAPVSLFPSVIGPRRRPRRSSASCSPLPRAFRRSEVSISFIMPEKPEKSASIFFFL